MKTILLTLLFSLPLFAGNEGGGGSSSNLAVAILSQQRDCAIKSLEVRFWYQAQKTDLMSINAIATDSLKDPKARAMFDKMKMNGLAQDILKTKYRLSKKCVDAKGVSRSATSRFSPGATICLNPESIVDGFGIHISDAMILGLLAHELAHHSGFTDTEVRNGKDFYPLGTSVAGLIMQEDLSSASGTEFLDLSQCTRPSFLEMLKGVKYEVEF